MYPPSQVTTFRFSRPLASLPRLTCTRAFEPSLALTVQKKILPLAHLTFFGHLTLTETFACFLMPFLMFFFQNVDLHGACGLGRRAGENRGGQQRYGHGHSDGLAHGRPFRRRVPSVRRAATSTSLAIPTRASRRLPGPSRSR